jgi:hypothetical protein
VFNEQLGLPVDLPAAPDRVRDPKSALHALLSPRRVRNTNVYALFGEQVSFAELRKLSAFVTFETALGEFVRSLGPG